VALVCDAERRLEHHEHVLEVTRNWVKGSTNRLVFVENVARYALYDSDHQVGGACRSDCSLNHTARQNKGTNLLSYSFISPSYVVARNRGKVRLRYSEAQNYCTQTEVTSQSLWLRYDRHFGGITRHNALR